MLKVLKEDQGYAMHHSNRDRKLPSRAPTATAMANEVDKAFRKF